LRLLYLLAVYLAAPIISRVPRTGGNIVVRVCAIATPANRRRSPATYAERAVKTRRDSDVALAVIRTPAS